MNSEVKSAARILEVLELLSSASEPVTLKEVVEELGYPKSSTHGLLITLVSRGYAIRDDRDRYALNTAFRTNPGWVGGKEAQLIALARPIMDELRDQVGESVFLGARMRNGDIRRLAKSVSRQEIRYDTERDAPIPAYCTAMGRILLAFWDRESAEAYLANVKIEAHTQYTVTDRAAMRRLLDKVRRDGYALNDQEMVLGGTGVAAPVRNKAGKVIATLNLGVVTSRFVLNRDGLIAAVKTAAGRLSARLGFKEPHEKRAA